MCSQNLDLRRNRRRAWASVYLAGRDSTGIGNRRAADCGACGYDQATDLPKCEKRLNLVGMDLRMTGRRFELPARYEMKTCVSIGLVLTRWVGAGISPRPRFWTDSDSAGRDGPKRGDYAQLGDGAGGGGAAGGRGGGGRFEIRAGGYVAEPRRAGKRVRPDGTQ